MINNINSLNAHQTLMNINANNIANVNFQAQDGKIESLKVRVRKGDSVNLSKEIVEQIIIEDGFKAQIPTIKTQDEMTKTLLDIKV